MKFHSFLRSALLSAGILALSAATSFGQAAGGRGIGTAGLALPMPAAGLPSESYQPAILNDMEVTEITRTKLTTLTAATKTVDAARAELTTATYVLPVNGQNIAAKVQALVNAEAALASGRADTYAIILKGLKDATPEKKSAVARAIGGAPAPAAGGRGGN